MGINELLKLNGIDSIAFFSDIPAGEKREYDMPLKVPQETPNGRKMVERRVTFSALKDAFFLKVDALKVHPAVDPGSTTPPDTERAEAEAIVTGSAGTGR